MSHSFARIALVNPFTAMAENSCTLAIAVIPNARRDEVVGWLGGALKIKIHAPPIEGRANVAVCEFLAKTLGLPRRAVTVVRGDTARRKTIRITGLGLTEAKTKLGGSIRHVT
jgi:uncharacterized protein (TIGR00251 family)